MIFRRLLRVFTHSADPGFELEQEGVEAHGMVVEVIERVSPDDARGRIRFQGSTWAATSRGGAIEAGGRARLICRDNLVWVVEPYAGPAAPGERG